MALLDGAGILRSLDAIVCGCQLFCLVVLCLRELPLSHASGLYKEAYIRMLQAYFDRTFQLDLKAAMERREEKGRKRTETENGRLLRRRLRQNSQKES